MAKRGRKGNKAKQNKTSSLQNNDVLGAGVSASIDKSTTVKKGDGSDKITKYFPASPKAPASSDSNMDKVDTEKLMTFPIVENIPGILTPETTPTKKPTKPASSTDSIESTVPETTPQQSPEEKTDSPQHKKKSVPNMVVAPQNKTEDVGDSIAAVVVGSKDKGESSKVEGQGQKKKSDGSKGKRTKSSKSRKSRSAKETSIQTNTLKDFFPVRRSNRRCKSEIEAEQQKDIEDAILTIREDGLKVTDIEGKGRGVVSTRSFRQGDFVVEYYGDLIDTTKAKERESEYLKDPSIGCYMYYFQFKNKNYCIDATAESGRLGRLLNHSTKSGNCCTKLVEVKGQPHLIIIAASDIAEGVELLYDYGDRNKDTLQAHPWLAL